MKLMRRTRRMGCCIRPSDAKPFFGVANPLRVVLVASLWPTPPTAPPANSASLLPLLLSTALAETPASGDGGGNWDWWLALGGLGLGVGLAAYLWGRKGGEAPSTTNPGADPADATPHHPSSASSGPTLLSPPQPGPTTGADLRLDPSRLPTHPTSLWQWLLQQPELLRVVGSLGVLVAVVAALYAANHLAGGGGWRGPGWGRTPPPKPAPEPESTPLEEVPPTAAAPPAPPVEDDGWYATVYDESPVDSPEPESRPQTPPPPDSPPPPAPSWLEQVELERAGMPTEELAKDLALEAETLELLRMAALAVAADDISLVFPAAADPATPAANPVEPAAVEETPPPPQAAHPVGVDSDEVKDYPATPEEAHPTTPDEQWDGPELADEAGYGLQQLDKVLEHLPLPIGEDHLRSIQTDMVNFRQEVDLKAVG